MKVCSIVLLLIYATSSTKLPIDAPNEYYASPSTFELYPTKKTNASQPSFDQKKSFAINFATSKLNLLKDEYIIKSYDVTAFSRFFFLPLIKSPSTTKYYKIENSQANLNIDKYGRPMSFGSSWPSKSLITLPESTNLTPLAAFQAAIKTLGYPPVDPPSNLLFESQTDSDGSEKFVLFGVPDTVWMKGGNATAEYMYYMTNSTLQLALVVGFPRLLHEDPDLDDSFVFFFETVGGSLITYYDLVIHNINPFVVNVPAPEPTSYAGGDEEGRKQMEVLMDDAYNRGLGYGVLVMGASLVGGFVVLMFLVLRFYDLRKKGVVVDASECTSQ